MKNSKGLELALNTIILIVILLIVLIVLAAFFLGGVGAGSEPLGTLLTQGSEGIKKQTEDIGTRLLLGFM